ncbi:MAG: hypothetical protein CL613_04590 [Aquimarina sp.]|nr:hypothetical protein [Aquimarina sp.]
MRKQKDIIQVHQRYKAVSKSDFHNAYECSPYTFRQWIKSIESKLGFYRGGLYTPRQVEMIVEYLGQPPKSEHIIYEK